MAKNKQLKINYVKQHVLSYKNKEKEKKEKERRHSIVEENVDVEIIQSLHFFNDGERTKKEKRIQVKILRNLFSIKCKYQKDSTRNRVILAFVYTFLYIN